MKQEIRFQGSLQVPGDKSVSHRALMFAALAQGTCEIARLSPAEDCQSTARCMQALGLDITASADHRVHIVKSNGLEHLAQPAGILDAGNSGTTIRLMSGLVSGRPFQTTFDGDASLRKRPMARVLNYLASMGAQITYLNADNFPPFTIEGRELKGQEFELKIASAQMQTAILLAGLQADGETTVKLPAPVRDHTERMFNYIGVPYKVSANGLSTTVARLAQPLRAFALTVPGDISSAAFFMVAAACAPHSHLTLTDVGLNPGRTLVIDVLREMGADITIEDQKLESGEPVGTVIVRGATRLKGTRIAGDRIAAGIDEIPILALAGAFCDGTLSIRDAAELRVKESDRLSLMANNLRQAGANLTEYDDGLDIEGKEKLDGGSQWSTAGDHRLAMTGLIASLLCHRPIAIDDSACVAVSYPDFQKDLSKLETKSGA